MRFNVLSSVLLLTVLPLTAAEVEIGAKLQPFVQRKVLAGAVAGVVDSSGLVATQTVGFADIAAKKPMTDDALFWIASMTKAITGTALMMLVDEGKVNLDDPVTKYIPDFKRATVEETGAKPTQAMTVRHLMCHMSGMPFSSPAEFPTLDRLPLDRAVLSYINTPLLHEPGSKFEYSNCGINTAGWIIEIISGMPYDEFMQKRLFEPLGMKDTTFWPSQEQLKRLARAYAPHPSGNGLEAMGIWALTSPYSDREKRFAMPGGGLFSTLRDLARFCRMLLNNGTCDGKVYLSEKALSAMIQRSTPKTVNETYGIGWALTPEWFGHGGAYATNFTIDRKRGLALIWLVQHNGFPKDGENAEEEFRTTAEKKFSKKK